MKNREKRASKIWSFQKRLLVNYLMIILATLLFLSVTLFDSASDMITDQVGASRYQVLEQVSGNIDQLCNGVLTAASLYSFNDELTQYMSGNKVLSDYEALIDGRLIESLFNGYMAAFSNLNLEYYAMVDGFNGRNVGTSESGKYNFESISEQPWYDQVLTNDGKVLWISTYNDGDSFKENYKKDTYVFTAARLVKNTRRNIGLGVLQVCVNHNTLLSLYQPILNESNDVFIIDGTDVIVSHQNIKLIGTVVDDSELLLGIEEDNPDNNFISADKKYLYSYAKIKIPDWTIIEKVELDELMGPSRRIFGSSLLKIFTISLGIALLGSVLISRKLTEPIKNLTRIVKSIGDGKFVKSEVVTSSIELHSLSTGLNHMTGEIERLMLKIREEELMKREAELDFLQAQINPHFIYNTLYSIRCMISMERNKDAEEMMMVFIALLQKTLASSGTEIPLSSEIETLKDYIILQQFRYHKSFQVEYNFEPEMLAYTIPKLLLQPLLENAIIYGMDALGRGTIEVGGYYEDEKFIIYVRDNGAGMSDEMVNKLNNHEKEYENKFSEIGIKNIHERIMMTYGDAYGLIVDSELGEGCVIRLIMPKKRG